MFKRLNIKGWRQFLNIDIEFHENLTVLTGANVPRYEQNTSFSLIS